MPVDLPEDPFTQQELLSVAYQEAEIAWRRLSYLRWACMLNGWQINDQTLGELRSTLAAADTLIVELHQ